MALQHSSGAWKYILNSFFTSLVKKNFNQTEKQLDLHFYKHIGVSSCVWANIGERFSTATLKLAIEHTLLLGEGSPKDKTIGLECVYEILSTFVCIRGFF